MAHSASGAHPSPWAIRSASSASLPLETSGVSKLAVRASLAAPEAAGCTAQPEEAFQGAGSGESPRRPAATWRARRTACWLKLASGLLALEWLRHTLPQPSLSLQASEIALADCADMLHGGLVLASQMGATVVRASTIAALLRLAPIFGPAAEVALLGELKGGAVALKFALPAAGAMAALAHLREVCAMLQDCQHRMCPRLLCFDHHLGVSVMECLDGTLDDIMRRRDASGRPCLGAGDLVSMVMQSAMLLADLHESGLVASDRIGAAYLVQSIVGSDMVYAFECAGPEAALQRPVLALQAEGGSTGPAWEAGGRGAGYGAAGTPEQKHALLVDALVTKEGPEATTALGPVSKEEKGNALSASFRQLSARQCVPAADVAHLAWSSRVLRGCQRIADCSARAAASAGERRLHCRRVLESMAAGAQPSLAERLAAVERLEAEGGMLTATYRFSLEAGDEMQGNRAWRRLLL
eukprot:scaffold5.g638.t1